MNQLTITTGVCVEGAQALDIEALARACASEVGFIHELMAEGLLAPQQEQAPWRFSGEALARARRIRRLQRDFDAPLASVAVMLDLLDQIESLRAQLRRAGLVPD
jgi:chaperone modulatory protein CbpM